MPEGYHHVAREQRSQISALKAIATLHYRCVSIICLPMAITFTPLHIVIAKLNMAYADIRQTQFF